MPKKTAQGALAVPAANTASITGPDLVNDLAARGVKVVVNITAIGTGSWTVVIEGKIGGTYVALLTSAALVANAVTTLTVYPGLTAAANVTASDVLPDQWRVRLVANNANPVTGSVAWSTLA